MLLVGDTGFELVTSSVSGQNLCLGMRAGVASAACGRSLMSVTVRVGWPTVWPTANRLPLRGVVMRACPRPALFGFLGATSAARSMCGYMNSASRAASTRSCSATNRVRKARDGALFLSSRLEIRACPQFGRAAGSDDKVNHAAGLRCHFAQGRWNLHRRSLWAVASTGRPTAQDLSNNDLTGHGCTYGATKAAHLESLGS
jgi:hypothetical protein